MGGVLTITSPADGRWLAEIVPASAEDVAAALARARDAQPAWAALGLERRARLVRDLAAALVASPALVDTLAAESGKPRHEAEGMEVFYLAALTRFLTGRRVRRAIEPSVERSFVLPQKLARVLWHPRGVVGVIGPWNFPLLNNFADCLAPLLAGNAVLLKPSELTPLTSLFVEKAWREAGLPSGVFQVIPGGAETGRELLEGVDLVFFTGSTEAGRQVARRAGERLIPCVLELGGKSAMIVLADADLEAAAAGAVWGAFAHSGQICVRMERVLVEAAVASRFEQLVVEKTRRIRPGDDVGALTDARIVARLERQIADAVARGARILSGGKRRSGRPGTWFEPTVLAGCTPEMVVMEEETFGPLLPIARVEDAEEALALANRSRRGLAGSVWSRDVARAAALAARMETGSVCINDVLVHYFSVEAPLAGHRESGLGSRHGREVLRPFCRVETILEDRPLLGIASRWIAPWMRFPYDPRAARVTRWLARRLL